MQRIVSQPPTEEIMAGVSLEMSSTPVSQIPTTVRKQTPPVEIPTQVQPGQQQEYGGVSPVSPGHLTLLQNSQHDTSSDGSLQPGRWATHVVARSSSPTPPQQFGSLGTAFFQPVTLQSGKPWNVLFL